RDLLEHLQPVALQWVITSMISRAALAYSIIIPASGEDCNGFSKYFLGSHKKCLILVESRKRAASAHSTDAARRSVCKRRKLRLERENSKVCETINPFRRTQGAGKEVSFC
ncbi:MAG TPA: hypothetical protein H9868_06500, partial [Candidatus Flavonifractor merdipullorum]|nr:hypothetical protein [Candidatus Flavonifractor merdipullorum]